MSRFGGIGVVLVASTLLTAAVVRAHNRSVSYSSWTVDGTIFRAEIRIQQRDVVDTTLAQIVDSFSFLSGDASCEVDASSIDASSTHGLLRISFAGHCPWTPTKMRARFLASNNSHLHLITVHQGSTERQCALTSAEIECDFQVPEVAQPPNILTVGITHVLNGWDHLMFLAMLVFPVRRLRSLFGLITGFTIGHALSLFLILSGRVTAFVPQVEAVIAISVAIAALEVFEDGRHSSSSRSFVVVAVLVALLAKFASFPALYGVSLFTLCFSALRDRDGIGLPSSLLLALCFGVFHGLGFGSALLQIDPNIDTRQFVLFNLGVEAGQAFVAAVIFVMVRVATRFGVEPIFRQAMVAAAVALSMYALTNAILI
ncbi:MAG: HupE/UreJ family protein [Polyangiales bacterium]